jgi:hypothetical protein
MKPEFIQRYSSRTHRIDHSVLVEHLKGAKRYHRIAGYFTSSLFEIAGEYLEGIEEVKIVCNSDVRGCIPVRNEHKYLKEGSD